MRGLQRPSSWRCRWRAAAAGRVQNSARAAFCVRVPFRVSNADSPTVVLSKSPTVQHAPLRLSHISAIKYVLMSSRLGVVVVPPGAGPWFFPSRPSARTQSLYMRHTESAHKDASTEGDRRDADATTSAVRPHGKKRGERQAARLGTCECQLILTPGIRSAGDALPPAHLLCAQPLPL